MCMRNHSFSLSILFARTLTPRRQIRRSTSFSRLAYSAESRCWFHLSLFLSFSYIPRRCTAGEILIVAPIRRFPGQGNRGCIPFILFISFNRILVSRYAPRCISSFSLRYRTRLRPIPVIYISVIIGEVFYPGLDENLFPSEVLSLSLSFSAFDSILRKTSVLWAVCHCRINLEVD